MTDLSVDEAVARLDLVQALDRFDLMLDPASASELLTAAMAYWCEEKIAGDTFLAIVSNVRDWLTKLANVLEKQHENGPGKSND